MLGADLVESFRDSFEIYATGLNDFPGNPAEKFMRFDLANDSYEELVAWSEPDVIIHCAAITNVDFCEQNPEKAMTVNGESVNKLIKSTDNARIIFISSEAVFADGIYMATEKDVANPPNVYARSKTLGEKYISIKGAKHCAIRTTIVGKNRNPKKSGFLEWLVKSMYEQKDINLFYDVIFTPITIWHLADELEWVIRNDVSGIIHIAGNEPISKYHFGLEIARRLGYDDSFIHKTSIENFEFKAKRSKDQTLDSSYYKLLSGRKLPTLNEMMDSITRHFEEYKHGSI